MVAKAFVLIVMAFLIVYVGAATIYLLVLVISYFVLNEKKILSSAQLNNFAVLVPAHNEEMLVGNLCQSILDIDYPKEKYDIFIIADNCTDNTTHICRQYSVSLLERFDPNNAGKGQALAWALNHIDLNHFNAIFIVDADNYVDSSVLVQLDKHINNDELAIQCYNAVGNRNDSWFTQLLYVSRTIGNVFYHEAKYRLGLSSYLMGNGLCFNTKLIKERGWTAFSPSEDWEYYAQLVESGIRIGFASKAKVYHQESCTLNQATSQRLRWSSGRFKIARTLGWRLIVKGIREKDWRLIDSSFPLIFPNYSLGVNLTLLALILSLFAISSTAIFSILFLILLGLQFIIFIAGSFIAGSPLKIFRAVLFAPVFLVWKGIIDFLCFTGLYRSNKWVRTRRHKPRSESANCDHL